ncbi:MAG: hypothetical protein JSS89_09550 [Bacteroidetes bacterium]|nr:hypothetical protein [Bacteroidota bacterium]
MKIRELVSKCRTNIHTWSLCLVGILPLTPQTALVQVDGVNVATLCSTFPSNRLLVRLDPAPFGLAELSSLRLDASLVRTTSACFGGSISGISGGGWTECVVRPVASYVLTPRWTVGGELEVKVAGAQGFAPVVQTDVALSCLAAVDTAWTLAARVTSVSSSVRMSCARRIDTNWTVESGLHITAASMPALVVHMRYVDETIALAFGIESAPMQLRLAAMLPTSTSCSVGCSLAYTASLGMAASLSLCFVAW